MFFEGQKAIERARKKGMKNPITRILTIDSRSPEAKRYSIAMALEIDEGSTTGDFNVDGRKEEHWALSPYLKGPGRLVLSAIDNRCRFNEARLHRSLTLRYILRNTTNTKFVTE